MIDIPKASRTGARHRERGPLKGGTDEGHPKNLNVKVVKDLLLRMG